VGCQSIYDVCCCIAADAAWSLVLLVVACCRLLQLAACCFKYLYFIFLLHYFFAEQFPSPSSCNHPYPLEHSLGAFRLLPQDVLLLRCFFELFCLRLFLACLRLLGKRLCLHPLGLHLVNGFDQYSLVLVGVTLGMAIEVMVQMLVNFLCLAVP